MPVYGVEESLRRRHAGEVARHVVVRLVPADTNISARCADQLLDLRQNEMGGGRRRARGDVRGQALTLLDVENGEALEERDGAGRLPIGAKIGSLR